VELRYTLTRNINEAPSGSIELTQILGEAQIISSVRPWVHEAVPQSPGDQNSSLAATTVCNTTSATTDCGGVIATIDPFFAKSRWGANFSSGANSAASSTITIDFSEPIDSYTVTVYDPDFIGNEVRATNAAGATVASVSVPGDDLPGTLTTQTVTVSGQGIRRILLIPGPEDYVEYGNASFDATPLADLVCTQVQRGATATCTASGDGVAVTGWSFAFPAYNLSPPGVVQGPNSGNTWSGTAVTSGTVTAQYSRNGTPGSAPLNATLAVQPRPWSWGPSDWAFTAGTGPICDAGPFTSNGSTTLGWNRRKGTCDGGRVVPHPPELPNGGYTIAVVTSGPNATLWYVTSVSYRMETESGLNPSILEGSPVTFQLLAAPDKNACKKALGASVTSVNFFNFNDKCKNVGLTPFIDGLWAHEGFGTSNNNGHEAQGRLAAADPANNVHRLVEGAFGASESDVRYNAADEAFQASRRMAIVSSSHAFVKDNWCGSLWRFNTATNRWIYSPVLASGDICI